MDGCCYWLIGRSVFPDRSEADGDAGIPLSNPLSAVAVNSADGLDGAPVGEALASQSDRAGADNPHQVSACPCRNAAAVTGNVGTDGAGTVQQFSTLPFIGARVANVFAGGGKDRVAGSDTMAGRHHRERIVAIGATGLWGVHRRED